MNLHKNPVPMKTQGFGTRDSVLTAFGACEVVRPIHFQHWLADRSKLIPNIIQSTTVWCCGDSLRAIVCLICRPVL